MRGLWCHSRPESLGGHGFGTQSYRDIQWGDWIRKRRGGQLNKRSQQWKSIWHKLEPSVQ